MVMTNLIILLVLFIGIYSGFKKGVILQLLQTIGYTITLIFSLDYYEPLSEFLYLMVPYPTPFFPDRNPYLFYDEHYIFSMDISYYQMLSFIALFLIGWLIVKFLTKLISYTLEILRAPEPISGIGGGILGFLVNYVGLFILLVFLTTIPIDFIQTRIYESSLAQNIITETPELSERVYNKFIVQVNQEVMEDLPTMELQPDVNENNEEPIEEN